ncbi:hypothetical protein [Streptomyces sp. NPDC007205]|uniref:hypothetical protein n=1 Tax=Streptomyces sp. NPDC007205 TaxID=3154316 RepID=UPI0033E37C13
MLRATGSGRATGTTWTRGRRGALTAASAAVVVLGGVLAAYAAHGPGGGYVAVGSAGGPERAGTAAATPTGAVSLVPLDGSRGTATANSPAATPGQPRPSSAATTPGSPEQPTAPAPGAPDPSGSTGDGRGGTDGRTAPPPSTSAAPTPGRGTAPAPADLAWGKPTTAPTDQRWCQKVTVVFHNSGGTAVRSGSVTFGTHIIGALGIDWATVTSTVDLPAPIAPGPRKDHTWTVCVDAWRVPLGMHIETRDVSVEWK